MGNNSQLQNAVSDDEGGPGDGGDGVYDDVDNWDMQKDKLLLQATTSAAAAGGRRQGGGGAAQQREVFALSGTDSDSDFDLPTVKKDKKTKKKVVEQEDESDGGMADSDVEEGGKEGRDEMRAWGSRKKHFYGG